jgi:hypothetical protein
VSAPYKSVHHAVVAAFMSEATVVMGRARQPSMDSTRAPSVQRPASAYQCAYEAIAEAHLAMRLIRRTLPQRLMAVLDSLYSDASDPCLHVRKVAAAHVVARNIVQADGYSAPDFAYVLAVVADWGGLAALNDHAEADRRGVHVRTLRRWRKGRTGYGQGIVGLLEDWKAEAIDLLTEPMQARGVVRDTYTECYNINIEPADADTSKRVFSFLPRASREKSPSGFAYTIYPGGD